MQDMGSLSDGYRAVVIGASGGIGGAFCRLLSTDPRCAGIFAVSRQSHPGFDVTDEASVAAIAGGAFDGGDIDLVINATGALTIDGIGPEKSIRAIDAAAMARQFAVNAIGPALLLKHFGPRLPRDRKGIFASLSARVGSIGDNRLGGWISYRAAKAAQNQILCTGAIEIARTCPLAVVVALHPGTVATPLSDPFSAGRDRLAPDASAARLLAVLDDLGPAETGGFYAYDGLEIPW